MQNDILFFAEQRNGRIQKICLELAGGAKRLASQTGGRSIAFLAGQDVYGEAQSLLQAGADCVFFADSPLLAYYSTDFYAELMEQAVQSVNPGLILLGSTTVGMDLAPALAVKLDAGLAADCTGLWADDGFRMARPSLDGAATDILYCPDGNPVIATLRPGVLTPLAEDEAFSLPAASADTVKELSLSLAEEALRTQNRVELIEVEPGNKRSDDITKARVLAAGGRGMGGPAGFETLKRIAELLGGSVACSRACIESGWADTACQVGQTGKTVRPALYLACGISGAFQHTTGMDGSGLIISINKNPAAPIFDISDLGIVGNVEVILPQLIQALEAYQGI